MKVFYHHNLEIFDVEEIPTHGGSLRLYVKHTTNNHLSITPNVKMILDKEHRYGLDDKTIHGTYHEINDNDNDHKKYKPIKHKPMFSFLDNEFQKETNGFNLDITSDVDFPKLGNPGMGRGKVK